MAKGRRWRLWLVTLALGGAFLFLACGPTNQTPPLIPHPPKQEDCVVCHRFGREGAPIQKHPDRGGCTNCHRYRR